MPEQDLIVERDAALALAERYRIWILRTAHACEDGRVTPKQIAARARAEIRAKRIVTP